MGVSAQRGSAGLVARVEWRAVRRTVWHSLFSRQTLRAIRAHWAPAHSLGPARCKGRAELPIQLLDQLTHSLTTLASVQRLRGKLLVHDEQPAAYAAVVRHALASA